MRYFVFLVIIAFIISCSSPKQAANNSVSILAKRDAIQNLTIKGTIRTNFPDLNQTAECRIDIAAGDSASFIIYGPMGMTIGKLFSTPNYFLFLNTFTSEAMEGKPNKENLKLVMQIPLAYSDFVSLLRNEPLNDNNLYQLQSPPRNDGKELYKCTMDGYADFALINKKSGNLEQYQRKSLDDKIIFTAVYEDFSIIEKHSLAGKITLQFPDLDGSVVLEVTKYEINPQFTKPFRFNIPSTVKRIKL